MKKKIILALTFIFIATIMTSAVSAGWEDMFNTEPEIENSHEVFIVGFNPDFPPFSYKDGDNYTGFDLDVAKEVCKRNNWTFYAQPLIDWESKDSELNSGEVDCIWGAFTINNREDKYAWSEPYFNNSQVFVVKSSSAINSTSDLEDKHIEVQEGSSVLKTLEDKNNTLKKSFATLTKVRDYETGFTDLEADVSDCFIGSIGMVNFNIVKHNQTSFKILDEPLSNENYGIGFKKNNTDLRDQVQKTLDEMFEDGTIKSIAKKYDKYNITERLIPPK